MYFFLRTARVLSGQDLHFSVTMTGKWRSFAMADGLFLPGGTFLPFSTADLAT